MHAGPLTHGATGQVATGEEGYSSGAGAGAWLDDGTKGLDFTGNLECAAVDFATVHLCEPPDTRTICILQHDDKMLHIPCSTRDKFNVVVTCMLLPTLAKIFCWQARCVLWRMAVTRAWYA